MNTTYGGEYNNDVVMMNNAVGFTSMLCSGDFQGCLHKCGYKSSKISISQGGTESQ